MFIPFLLFLFLSGCGHFALYQIDIQQGNAFNISQISSIHEGMSQKEVSQRLGSPLLKDPFHAQRWDYFYSYRKKDHVIEQRRFTLFFVEGRISKIENHWGTQPSKTILPKEDQL